MRDRHRRSVRIRGHDYASGLYAVTVCTFGRQMLFGRVLEGEMVLSRFGEIARDEWVRTGEVRQTVVLDAFVVMPDHVHLLFGIVTDDNRRGTACRARNADVPNEGTARRAPTDGPSTPRTFGRPVRGDVPTVIRSYKSAVTRRIRALDATARVWQRGFHDRVVRTDLEADGWRRYIAGNPAAWDPGAERADGHRA